MKYGDRNAEFMYASCKRKLIEAFPLKGTACKQQQKHGSIYMYCFHDVSLKRD